jgi:hypothetical protein
MWDNQGDGQHSLRIELSYSPLDHKWTVMTKLGALTFSSYTFFPSHHGPVNFPACQVTGGSVLATVI